MKILAAAPSVVSSPDTSEHVGSTKTAHARTVAASNVAREVSCMRNLFRQALSDDRGASIELR